MRGIELTWELATRLLSDSILFPALQIAIAGVVVMLLALEVAGKHRAGRGGGKMKVGRSATSMAIFYGLYIAVSGLLVSICLETKAAQDHRVFFVLIDALAVAYVFVANRWARNALLGLADRLPRIEQR